MPQFASLKTQLSVNVLSCPSDVLLAHRAEFGCGGRQGKETHCGALCTGTQIPIENTETKPKSLYNFKFQNKFSRKLKNVPNENSNKDSMFIIKCNI